MSQGRFYELLRASQAITAGHLDEAAREFPDENDEKYKDRDIPLFPDQEGQDYYRFRYDEYMNDVQAWFREYFAAKTNTPSSAAASQ